MLREVAYSEGANVVALMAKQVEIRAEPVEEKKRDRATAPIQVDKDIAKMVGIICQHKEITQAELISKEIRDFVEAQYAVVSAAIEQEVKLRKMVKAKQG